MASKKLFVSLYDETLDGSAEHLGGKGAGLHWMASQGLPVPPAMILPTTVCALYKADPQGTMTKIGKELKALTKFFKDKFGYMPLLSVRSGARVSMPGMMDTILNVGIDNDTYAEWEQRLGEHCTADSAKRLVEMYGSVVKGMDRHVFDGQPLEESIAVYTSHTGEEFPNAEEQLLGSIEAVFNSWDNERAKIYRKLNDIPEDWGTAVVVQAMVFGNLGDTSCTGVLFTRNPDSGEPGVVGEYLINAQGEDVVAGIRTPDPISQMQAWNPAVYHELMTRVTLLEESRKDMQDVEFTVQDGKLYILQTRNAKRSARAAIRTAVDFHNEGLPLETALSRVSAKQFDLAQQSILDPKFTGEPFATGIPACSGVVTGLAVTSAEAAINCTEPCILVTQETTPDDIGGMNAALGILTMTGGATSHAAVVARGMNKPCVVGLGMDIGSFVEGKTQISIDGATGRVWLGTVPVVDGSKNLHIQTFRQMMWKHAQVFPLGLEPQQAPRQMIRLPELLYIPTDQALAKVQSMLESSSGHLLIDLSATLCPHEQLFFGPFQVPGYESRPVETQALLVQLEKKLTAAQASRLTLLTSQITKLDTVPCATDLETLVMVEKGANIVWSGASTPAVEKVMEWKLSEGVKLVSFGVMMPGGYVTERQLIAGLLS